MTHNNENDDCKTFKDFIIEREKLGKEDSNEVKYYIKNIEYQNWVRQQMKYSILKDNNSNYAENIKYSLTNLYYWFLEIVLKLDIYQINKSELPEIVTLPYLYIRKYCNIEEKLLENLTYIKLREMEDLRKNPGFAGLKNDFMIMYIERCFSFCRVPLPDSPKEKIDKFDINKSELANFVKTYLDFKRRDLSTLNTNKGFLQ